MKKKQLKPEPYMMNRELSWLKFNERVLNEAGNPRVPLAERLTFASIYQSNLDEFYMVRVGTLMDQMESSEVVRENKTNMTSKEQVKAIIDATRELDIKKAVIYEQLMGELEPQGIRIINFNRLSNEEGRLLEQYFDAHIAPFLSPMVIGKQQPFPFLANKQLYAIVLLTSQKGKKKTGIVPCSNSVFKRLIEIPTRPGCFMLSEELILHTQTISAHPTKTPRVFLFNNLIFVIFNPRITQARNIINSATTVVNAVAFSFHIGIKQKFRPTFTAALIHVAIRIIFSFFAGISIHWLKNQP